MSAPPFVYSGRESLRNALKNPPYGGLVTVPYLLGIVSALETEILRLSAVLAEVNVTTDLDAERVRVRADKARAAGIRGAARRCRRILEPLVCPPPQTTGGHVYFIDGGDVLKIGWTKDVRARIADLQIGSAAPLKLVAFIEGDLRAEREMHKRLRAYRRKGEWFAWSDAILSFVLELRGDLDALARLRTRKAPPAAGAAQVSPR